ncbi:hypothetical protein HK103_002848 [Boothiomyces macroporosus]|uniref:PB1 domain-containing protein n=1 Tax=Boothiomyces macroporosus TaxID=261099 RepID=A0AAD5UIQ7_9FUNG|nr:hypothetical protein HK103_002828 [Boothiomyces macroporosus]KAJ3259201.1 hypothetical protein HK103_002848 [Boothiomyces macroporosus]
MLFSTFFGEWKHDIQNSPNPEDFMNFEAYMPIVSPNTNRQSEKAYIKPRKESRSANGKSASLPRPNRLAKSPGTDKPLPATPPVDSPSPMSAVSQPSLRHKPTFEEFCSDLAESLGVNLNKKQSIESLRDTIMESKSPEELQSPAYSLYKNENIEYDNDTLPGTLPLISNPLKLEIPQERSILSQIFSGQSQDTILDDMSLQRIRTESTKSSETITDDTVQRSQTEKAPSRLSHDTEIDRSTIIRRINSEKSLSKSKIREELRKNSENAAMPDLILPKINIGFDESFEEQRIATLKRSAFGSNRLSISIPSRKESRNWSASAQTSSGDKPKNIAIIKRSDSPANNSSLNPTTNEDNTMQSELDYQAVTSPSDILNDYNYSPVIIDYTSHNAQKESGYESLPYESLDRVTNRSVSPSTEKSRESIAKESISTLLRGIKRRNNSKEEGEQTQTVDAEVNVKANRLHELIALQQSMQVPDGGSNFLTLRLIISTGSTVTVRVAKTIDIDTLREKLARKCTLLPDSFKWKKTDSDLVYLSSISYRDPDMEILTIDDQEDWLGCLDHCLNNGKLTLFINVQEL